MSYLALSVPRTGLEPARLAALAPETSASTIPPPGQGVAPPFRSGSLSLQALHAGFPGFAVQSYETFFNYHTFLCSFFLIFVINFSGLSAMIGFPGPYLFNIQLNDYSQRRNQTRHVQRPRRL